MALEILAIKEEIGVRDLPLKVKLAFAVALKSEAEGDDKKAEKYLNLAVKAEEDLLATDEDKDKDKA